MLSENKIVKSILIKLSILFKTDNFILSIGVLSILPFILISYFNNPTSDDFCYNCASRDQGFWTAQLTSYNEWSGRYFSTAFLSNRALVADSFVVYKLMPILLLFSLFASIYFLISVLFDNLKKRDKYILTLSIMTMYLIQVPTISEGLYWLAGSVTYLLSSTLAVLLFSFLIKLLETKEKKYLFLSLLFSFCVVGANEVSMLFINFIIGVILVFKSVQHKRINYSLLLILIFTIIFSLIVICAPGNAVRSEYFPYKNHFLFSTAFSIFSIIDYLSSWLPFIIMLSLLLLNYFNKNRTLKVSKIFDLNPIMVLLIILTIPFLGFFIGFWTMGRILPLRTINIIYFYFLLGLVFLALVLLFKLQKENSSFVSFSKWVKYLLFIVLISQLVQKNNIRKAYSDLLSGRAYQYDLELKSRYKMIKNSTSEIVTVPELIAIPETLFSGDITGDTEDWKNACYDLYFAPKKVKTKPNKK